MAHPEIELMAEHEKSLRSAMQAELWLTPLADSVAGSAGWLCRLVPLAALFPPAGSAGWSRCALLAVTLRELLG